MKQQSLHLGLVSEKFVTLEKVSGVGYFAVQNDEWGGGGEWPMTYSPCITSQDRKAVVQLGKLSRIAD